MADPFTAEIRAFGFNFAPSNWAFCNGQQMMVQQNTPLFSLLGATYGGNGQSTFNLPNLQGSTPVDVGTGTGLTQRILGEEIGSSTVSLDQTTMPAHTHTIVADAITVAAQAQLIPLTSSFLTRNMGQQIYSDVPGTGTPMAPQMIGPNGSSLGHENMQPYQVTNFCICLYGEWPARP